MIALQSAICTHPPPETLKSIWCSTCGAWKASEESPLEYVPVRARAMPVAWIVFDEAGARAVKRAIVAAELALENDPAAPAATVTIDSEHTSLTLRRSP